MLLLANLAIGQCENFNVSFVGATAADSTISLTKAKAALGLSFANKSCHQDYEVTQFKMTITLSSVPITKKSMSNKLTDHMKSVLSKAKSGCTISFTEVVVQGKDGATIKQSIPDLTFRAN